MRRKIYLKWNYIIFCMIFIFTCSIKTVAAADEKPLELYAASAVLMDGESGRILYEKNGTEVLPNASTTKIMTCILALEKGNLNDLVTVSSYAASMPDVQLNIKGGEQYRLEDLLYSLMLASHNDSAVAVAEYIGGTIDVFAGMMNAKAKEIGCRNTFFITPNGLDATKTVVGEDGKEVLKNHGTTAEDLAKIMRYCVLQSPEKDRFCQITQTQNHTFSNKVGNGARDGNRSFTCVNHNAFLQMWNGAISGKTGFTGKAGYCYIGACNTKNGVLIGALLASGWPPAKTRKWKDMRTLLQYGESCFEPFEQPPENWESIVMVKNGKQKSCRVIAKEKTGHTILKGKQEVITRIIYLEQSMQAPVQKGQKIGEISYQLNGTKWYQIPIVTNEKIEKMTIADDMNNILQKWLL